MQMREYHYFPPTQADQRAFLMQVLGALLGIVLIVILWWSSSAFELRAVLIGAAIAVLWMLGAAAWQLEKKARRAQVARVAFDENILYVTDWRGVNHQIPWEQITRCEVKGGRLLVLWEGGKLHVGAREIERGMEFTQHVARVTRGKKSTFIPLTPKDAD